MIKIVFSQVHYPLTMGRYIWEALLRRDDVEVWSTGPFSGTYIPWGAGMDLAQQYVRTPDLPLPMGTQPTIMYSAIENKLPDGFEPDLWLEANSVLTVVGRPQGKYAVIGTDPHVLNDSFYAQSRSTADYFFCMQTPYMKEGDIWLPYAYAPDWHARTPIPWGERKYDCSLLGLAYQGRRIFFERAKERGHSVRFEIGKVFDEARDIYHETKVGFNWSSMDDTTARVFELMAMGIPAIMNPTTDLTSMFNENEHFISFLGVEQALEKLEWALSHPEEVEAMAERAYQAVKPHTWDARVETILQETGVL